MKPIQALLKKLKTNFFLSVIGILIVLLLLIIFKYRREKLILQLTKWILFFLETYFDSAIQSDNDNLEIPGISIL